MFEKANLSIAAIFSVIAMMTSIPIKSETLRHAHGSPRFVLTIALNPSDDVSRKICSSSRLASPLNIVGDGRVGHKW
ncbi:hypothetical protein BFJ66_g15774 [Fusarium oxysporum f. sp. cepae]|uniref:Uncharacterized protein n=1 Tax=Fusarium oxysporum f. sp. cepae TaxID=396571 RepID=A0A3L6NCX7_FUSOX|nr:hypothetical protein BFJ65_g9403 [Fusarium oxysporum f. sp. cepae]RKK31598.1 hypothetical protein BFJ66_g15774 [Fusarium oxysporum f. sp. cepae]